MNLVSKNVRVGGGGGGGEGVRRRTFLATLSVVHCCWYNVTARCQLVVDRALCDLGKDEVRYR